MTARTPLLLIAVLAAGNALARESDSRLPDSVRRIERETGGEVLSAQPMHRSGEEVARVKVLMPDGRVRVLRDRPGDDSRRDELYRDERPGPPRYDFRRDPDDDPRGGGPHDERMP